MTTPRYWFPAKRYGWGWGPPATWQGWLCVAIFTVLLLTGLWLFDPRIQPLGFVLYVTVLSLAMVAVCWWKGEPPGWRWG